MRIPHILHTMSYNFGYQSSSHSLISLNVAYATSTNSLNPAFSSCITYNIRSSITIKTLRKIYYLKNINNRKKKL